MQYLKNMQFKHILSLVSVVGIFSLLGILLLKPIPDANKDVVNISIGTLIGGLIARIAGNYFPSSTSAKKGDKTETANE